MAKSQPTLTAADWDFLLPQPCPAYSLAGQANTICVRVKNNGTNVGFKAEVHAYGAASSGPVQDLIQEGSGSQFFSRRISAAQVNRSQTGSPNNTVTVTPVLNDGVSLGVAVPLDFEAVSGGSGSGSGTCNDPSVGAALLAEVFQPGQPVPVALSAEFGPPNFGGARKQAATLIYSGAPGFERCWFSQPLDVRSDGDDPALWMLERTDARTWLLRLRRGGLDLVVYRHTALVEKDGALPVRLKVVGNGDGTDWPSIVTLTPAP